MIISMAVRLSSSNDEASSSSWQLRTPLVFSTRPAHFAWDDNQPQAVHRSFDWQNPCQGVGRQYARA